MRHCRVPGDYTGCASPPASATPRPTLADRIAKGPIPVDEALPIAKEIAEALEAAHEAGVIHRDLKSANVKVKDDGTVKILGPRHRGNSSRIGDTATPRGR